MKRGTFAAETPHHTQSLFLAMLQILQNKDEISTSIQIRFQVYHSQSGYHKHSGPHN